MDTERTIITSSVVVAGVYAYRRISEGSGPPTKGSAAQLAGFTTPPATIGRFATAWGFTYLTLAIIGEASPKLGAGLAILIAVSDLLSNITTVAADVNAKLGQSPNRGSAGAGYNVPTPSGTMPAPASLGAYGPIVVNRTPNPVGAPAHGGQY